MSWQDVRSFYEEGDDDPAPEPVELAEFRCWWCGCSFVQPADDPGRFCSLDCDLRWCKWSDTRQEELP